MERRVAGSSAEAASFVAVAWPPSGAAEAPSSGLVGEHKSVEGEHKSVEDSIVAVAEDMSNKVAEAGMSASEGTYYLHILLLLC